MNRLVTGFLLCFYACIQTFPALAEQPAESGEQKTPPQVEKNIPGDPESRVIIKTLQNDPAIAAKAKAAGINEQKLQKIKNKLLSDPEVTALILSLKNDPEMLKLLDDPEIMRAIKNRDIKALLKDPRIAKMIDKQKVKGMLKRARE